MSKATISAPVLKTRGKFGYENRDDDAETNNRKYEFSFHRSFSFELEFPFSTLPSPTIVRKAALTFQAQVAMASLGWLRGLL